MGDEYIRMSDDMFLDNSIYPVFGHDGNVARIVYLSRDIAERKRMENELIALAAIVESSGDAIMGMRLDGTIFSWNIGAERIYGYTAEEVRGRSIMELVPRERRHEILEYLARASEGEHTNHFETIRIRKDGKPINISINISPIADEMGEVIGASAIARDITEQKQTSEALRESNEKFRAAFENAAVGIGLTALDGSFIKVNKSFCNTIGYTEEELLTKDFQSITHPDDVDTDMTYTEKLLKGEIPYFHMEKRYIHKNGNSIWGNISVSLVRDSNDKPLYYIGQVQDITERKRAESELKRAKMEAEEARRRAEYLANTDYLTGILNRRAFMTRLNDELDGLKRQCSPISLILADIDRFKKINDTFGHLVGDLALQEFSKCLSSFCRDCDFIGRHGGEEFIICLPNTSWETARLIAERMREAVEEMKIPLQDLNDTLSITASFGIASANCSKIESVDSIIGEADTAMYRAKSEGRNRVCRAGNI